MLDERLYNEKPKKSKKLKERFYFHAPLIPNARCLNCTYLLAGPTALVFEDSGPFCRVECISLYHSLQKFKIRKGTLEP